MNKQRTVIIGAGQAGGTVAASLRQLGYTGSITLVGDERWPPYERPPLSKALLQGTIEIDKTFLRSADFYSEQDITLVTDRRVSAIDRAGRLLQLDNGEALPYDQLVIATGARARRLNVPGSDSPNIHVLRGIDDALALRAALVPSARLLIVGGGFIGLEIAASARALGIAVTVIEQATTLMGRVLPSAMAEYLASVHASHGVDIRTGVTLLGFEARPDGGVTAQTSAGPLSSTL